MSWKAGKRESWKGNGNGSGKAGERESGKGKGSGEAGELESGKGKGSGSGKAGELESGKAGELESGKGNGNGSGKAGERESGKGNGSGKGNSSGEAGELESGEGKGSGEAGELESGKGNGSGEAGELESGEGNSRRKAGEPDRRNGLVPSGEVGPDASASPGSRTPGAWGRAAAMVALGLGAMACRPEVVVLGPLLVLRTLLEGKERLLEKQIAVPVGALILLAIVYFSVAKMGQDAVLAAWNTQAEIQVGWGGWLARVSSALTLQLGHVVWPTGLHPLYVPKPWGLEAWIGLGLWGLLIGATLWDVLGSEVPAKGWLLWWMFYLPASNIVFLPRYTADTYMYLPLLGLVMVAASLLERLGRVEWTEVRGVSGRKRRLLVYGGIGVVVALLSVRTADQIRRWQNTETLFAPVIEEHPNKALPYQVIGRYHVRRGDPQAARESLEAGMDVMFTDGHIPVELIRTLEATGEPRRAAELIMRMYGPDYPGEPTLALATYFTGLLVEHRLPLSDHAKLRQVVRSAAGASLGSLERQWSPARLLQAARYFAGHGETALAAAYTTAALRRRPSLCEGWSLVERLRRADERKGFEGLPERPGACVQ